MAKAKKKKKKRRRRAPPETPERSLFYLALADLHVGHATGVAPRGIQTHAGNLWIPNFAQDYLASCFGHLQKNIPDQIDGMFLVGDLAEGQNLAADSIFLSEPHPLFQARAVVTLLQPLADRTLLAPEWDPDQTRNIWVVSGSRYHAGRQHQMEEIIGQLLRAKPRGVQYAPAWRKIRPTDPRDVMFDVAHHQSFTYRYRSMPMEREAEFALVQFAKQRRVPPRIIIFLRAHTHSGFRVWRESGEGGSVEIVSISLPSFKIQDEFAQGSKMPNRMIPDNLGAVGIWIHPRPVNGSRVAVQPFLYDHPGIPEEVIE